MKHRTCTPFVSVHVRSSSRDDDAIIDWQLSLIFYPLSLSLSLSLYISFFLLLFPLIYWIMWILLRKFLGRNYFILNIHLVVWNLVCKKIPSFQPLISQLLISRRLHLEKINSMSHGEPLSVKLKSRELGHLVYIYTSLFFYTYSYFYLLLFMFSYIYIFRST